MANTDPVEFRLLDTDLVAQLCILPVASGHLYLELNEPGSGEIRISLDSAAAALVEEGQFVAAYYRGAYRGGFLVENIKKDHANEGENGGRWMSVSGRGGMALLEDVIIWSDSTDPQATTRTWENKSKGYILTALIEEGFDRNAFTNFDYDFGDTTDSNSVTWADREDIELPVGMSLLDVVRQFAETGEIEFSVRIAVRGLSTYLTLSAYQGGIGTDKTSTVYFRIGSNCMEMSYDERGTEKRNPC